MHSSKLYSRQDLAEEWGLLTRKFQVTLSFLKKSLSKESREICVFKVFFRTFFFLWNTNLYENYDNKIIENSSNSLVH